MGFMTIDMSRRAFATGMAPVRGDAIVSTQVYKGRDWQRRLVDDAVTVLRKIAGEVGERHE